MRPIKKSFSARCGSFHACIELGLTAARFFLADWRVRRRRYVQASELPTLVHQLDANAKRGECERFTGPHVPYSGGVCFRHVQRPPRAKRSR
jgi:hypothetical protein